MHRSTAADVMTRDVASVRPETLTADVARLLHDREVRAVPVVDADDRLLGVVSEADLMVTLERGDPRPPTWWRPRRIRRPGPAAEKAGATTAGELMTDPVVTAGPAESIAAVARRMREHRVSWMPVVDEDDRVVGVLGRSDLLTVFLRSDEDLRREVLRDVARTLSDDPQRLDVSVRDGVVALRGQVPTHADAVLIRDLVERTEGVVAVDAEITWEIDERDVRPPMFGVTY